MIKIVYQQFSKISDKRSFSKRISISLKDHLMSGLAVFGLKCPSLLEFDKKRSDNVIEKNLRDLYRINTVPCDSYLQERLDEVDPSNLRPAFSKVFAAFQRGKGAGQS